MNDPKGVPVSLEDWEQQYKSGRWAYLGNPQEMARYAVICAYLNRYSKDMRLLDVGGGECVLWNYMDQSRVVHYTCIDLSPTALANAKVPEDKRTLITADIDDYEFPEGSEFDAIVFNEVLAYPKHPMRVMKRFSQHVVRGGLVIVSLWHSPDPNTAYSKSVMETWQAIDQGPWQGLDETVVTNLPTRRSWRIRAMTTKD